VRRRIVTVAVLAAVLAITLFGVPLGYAVAASFLGDEAAQAEHVADVAAIAVAAHLARGESVTALPSSDPEVSLALYSVDGRRVIGDGPAQADPTVREALGGRVVSDPDAPGGLAVAVPVTDGTTVTGVVRASTPYRGVWLQIAGAWSVMVALGAVAVLATWLLARHQARRLSAPLESLAGAAQRLGEGDFSVRTTATGIPEIDAAGSALDVTAGRLGDLVSRERAFSSHASHQLRTPLTGLRLTLETAIDAPAPAQRVAVGSALESADRLERTIGDLLSLARHRPGDQAALPLDDLVADWTSAWSGVLAGRGRRLQVTTAPELPVSRASAGAVRQVVDVLVDNAVVHGGGTVALVVRDAGATVAIDVSDEGDGPPDPDAVFRSRQDGASGHGIGLALARALAEAEGGRLVLSRARPPVFSLLLPAAGTCA
jgi:signal transduction histidine kinase